MERTIDGIDYIAKSEVLRLIDEEIAESSKLANLAEMSERSRYGWLAREMCMREFRRYIANPQER